MLGGIIKTVSIKTSWLHHTSSNILATYFNNLASNKYQTLALKFVHELQHIYNFSIKFQHIKPNIIRCRWVGGVALTRDFIS